MKSFVETIGVIWGKSLLIWGCLAAGAALFVGFARFGAMGSLSSTTELYVVAGWAVLAVSIAFFVGNVILRFVPPQLQRWIAQRRADRLLEKFHSLDEDARAILFRMGAESVQSMWMGPNGGADALRGAGLAVITNRYERAFELSLLDEVDEALQSKFAVLASLEPSSAAMQRLETTNWMALQAVNGGERA